MTIGTPLWDDFVENLKEVKLTVEGMGFMPVNPPSDKELQAMSPEQKNIVEEEFKKFYCCYAETWTRVVHNNIFVKVEKVNYNNKWDEILAQSEKPVAFMRIVSLA